MKKKKQYLVIILLLNGILLAAQNKEMIPDLSKTNDKAIWKLHNRELKVEDGVHLNAKQGDGLLWLKDSNFSYGTIEVDIKGKDVRGRSFVGIAFHGLNDSTFDAIYFRPFNFKSPERKGHSVQYISHPENSWYILRKKYPEKYENQVSPVPDPAEWFHAKIIIKQPNVKVFINDSDTPSLVINQLISRQNGWLGFWVGNGSDGSFRNLKITQE